MSGIQVQFRGLCLLADRTSYYEVRMPTGSAPTPCLDGGGKPQPGGDAAPHVAILSLPILALDPTTLPLRWKPDFLTYVDGEQIGCWILDKTTLIDLAAGASAPVWAEGDRAVTINLHTMYPGNRIKDLTTPAGHPVMFLTGGRLASGDSGHLVVGTGTTAGQDRAVAESVVWYPDLDTLHVRSRNGDELIVVKAATITVSNLSNEGSMTMADHFRFFYDLLRDKVGCDDRLTFKVPGATTRMENTYDCTPPGTGS